MELPNIAAYAYQDVHVWSALLTCLRPPLSSTHVLRGIGRVGPAASRYTKGLILDQHVRHVPKRVGATAGSVQGVANNQCT